MKDEEINTFQCGGENRSDPAEAGGEDPCWGEVLKGFQTLQSDLLVGIEAFEPEQRFFRDSWAREDGLGKGLSCVLSQGRVFEKAGVGYSEVWGDSLPGSALSGRKDLVGQPFRACGVSVVVHPLNPYVPVSHMNVRYFSCGQGEPRHWWFGGGFDLTPSYGFVEDCLDWHLAARRSCAFLPDPDRSYEEFKTNCDGYFRLPHRGGVGRGIGGLFFDNLTGTDWESLWHFVMGVGREFQKGYFPIVRRRMDHPWGEREREFLLRRRARYVEFNLIHDRGTLFGLQSGGRAESILMSLPPLVRFDYRTFPCEEELALEREYLKPRDWLSITRGTQ